jgi:hypothetical protein
MEHRWNDTDRRNGSAGGKPVRGCVVHHTSYELAWARTQVSVAKSRRQTAWNMHGTARIRLSRYVIWRCTSHLSSCTPRAHMNTSQYLSRLHHTVTGHSATVCCRMHTDSGDSQFYASWFKRNASGSGWFNIFMEENLSLQADICPAAQEVISPFRLLYEVSKQLLAWRLRPPVRDVVSATRPHVEFSWKLLLELFTKWRRASVSFKKIGPVTVVLCLRTQMSLHPTFYDLDYIRYMRSPSNVVK